VIESDVQKLAPGAIVDMFELDATTIGGSVIRWHNGVNALGNDVVWQGNSYTRFPVEASGFQRSGKGTLPRPVLKVANVSGLTGALARELGDLCGAKVTRRRTFVKYLDAVNFAGGVNPQADPLCGFPDEVWFVDRKASENGVFIEFELAAAFDVAGVKLPRRQCVQNVCTWGYRSAECGYTGGPVADKNDAPTSDPALDQCGKRLLSCKKRFGEFDQLNFGSFPGVGLIR
jgi:lambda family phage minor tail protein L